MPEKRSYRLGLIGHPVSHSLSPALHEAALAYHGLAGRYDLIDVEPSQLESRLRSLIEEGFDGVNVTIPHKQAVIPLLDRLTPCASQVGAVNTIRFLDGKAIGDNTDIYGFTTAIKEFFERTESQHLRFNNRALPDNALVIGAGGAARAVVLGLNELGFANVYIKARDRIKAQHFVESIKPAVQASLEVIAVQSSGSGQNHDLSLVVNATPLGQKNDDVSWIAQIFSRLPGDSVFFDLVYARSDQPTALVQRALMENIPALDGTTMLVHQADRSFSIWTGKNNSAGAMLAALTNAASGRTRE